MNALTQAPEPSSSVLAYTLPPDLRRAISFAEKRVYSSGSKDEAPLVKAGSPPSMADQEQARAVLDEMASVPMVNARVMNSFLGLVNLGVAGNSRMSKEDLAAAVPVYVMACQHLPAAAFSGEAAVKGLQQWKWMPGTSEVCALGEQVAAEWLKTRDDLRGLVAMQACDLYGPPSAPRAAPAYVPPSQEEKAAVSAMVKDMEAAMKARQAAAAAAKPQVTARPIMPDHLAALRNENPLVQRARAMRDRMEGERA